MVTSEVLVPRDGPGVRVVRIVDGGTDRLPRVVGLGRAEAEALAREDERGRAVILSPDFAAGVERFTG